MTEERKKKVKVCELCEEQPATILCSECCKCYCNGCSEFAHSKSTKRKHKVETISSGIMVDTRCPLHKDDSLKLFCVDEVKLCCGICDREQLHKGHTVVKITDISKDNSVFSASKVRTRFNDAMKCDTELEKKIEEVIEKIKVEETATKERIRQTFIEAHDKLNKEELKIMESLENVCSESEEALKKNLNTLREVREYSKLLTNADSKIKHGEKRSGSSRMMELNIVSEMEKQCRALSQVHKMEMADLEIGWDSEGRKLSFSRHLFNGAPVPRNIRLSRMVGEGVEISWDCDESKMDKEDTIVFTVEARKGDEKEGAVDGNEWKEVYTGSEMKATVPGLEMDTDYDVRVKCAVGDLQGCWSDIVSLTTPSIPPPSNIVAKSETWNSITLTWDAVEGASFYLIEFDEKKIYSDSSTNRYIKTGLLPDTEYSFKVCTASGEHSTSEWSEVVRGRTQKETFEYSAWQECPKYVNLKSGYVIDEKNPRAVSNGGGGYCTIIGNTTLPLNSVLWWSIRILKSKENDGGSISVGVAPADINQNKGDDPNYGWYFECYFSSLCSGPPHNYKWPGKDYGPRKGGGSYVHTGDTVGVVMDTTAKGELSFIVNKASRGIGYRKVPLDKPLVPCVLLGCAGDSVEFFI